MRISSWRCNWATVLLWAVVNLCFLIVPPVPAVADQVIENTGDRLPAEMVCFDSDGDISDASHVLLVDKEKQKLLVYAWGTGGIKQVGVYRCSTGKARGAKQRSGDQKTPEGVYFFVKKHLQKDLTPIYGSMAFPLDYPNRLDRLAGRSGYAIWLHGTNKPLKPRDSNGCIVVENSTIENLAAVIRLYRTPIIITAGVQYRSFDWINPDLPAIRQLIKRWCHYLARGSYVQLRKLYARNLGPDMRWWSRWCSLRKIPGDGHMKVGIIAAGMKVYQQGDVFCVTFDQILICQGRRLPAGRKKMFLRKQAGKMHIITEGYLAPPDGKDRLFVTIKEICNG